MTTNTPTHATARTAISAGRSRDLPLTPAVARLATATVAPKLTTTNATTTGMTAAVGPLVGMLSAHR